MGGCSSWRPAATLRKKSRLSQSKAAAPRHGPEGIGSAQAMIVTINGGDGLWIEGYSSGPCSVHRANSSLIRQVIPHDNLLVWEHEGVRYSLLVDSSIAREEAIRIAESLR